MDGRPSLAVEELILSTVESRLANEGYPGVAAPVLPQRIAGTAAPWVGPRSADSSVAGPVPQRVSPARMLPGKGLATGLVQRRPCRIQQGV
jgi:hypothetical protein